MAIGFMIYFLWYKINVTKMSYRFELLRNSVGTFMNNNNRPNE